MQSSDLILVFRTRRGVESLNRGNSPWAPTPPLPPGRWALRAGRHGYQPEGGNLRLLAGARPVAGIALDGAVLGVDNDANAAVFGGKVTHA